MGRKTKEETMAELGNYEVPLWKSTLTKLQELCANIEPQQMYVNFLEVCLQQIEAASPDSQSRPSSRLSSRLNSRPSSRANSRPTTADTTSASHSRANSLGVAISANAGAISTAALASTSRAPSPNSSESGSASSATPYSRASSPKQQEERMDRDGFMILCRNFLNIPKAKRKDGISDKELNACFTYVEAWDHQSRTISGAQWVRFMQQGIYVPQNAYPEPNFKVKLEGEVPGLNPEDDQQAADALESVMSLQQMKSHLNADTPKSAELMFKHGVITEEEFEALDIPHRTLTRMFRRERRRRKRGKAKLAAEARQLEEAAAAAEEAERQRLAALPHISKVQPAPNWLLHTAHDHFDPETKGMKFEQRVREHPRVKQAEEGVVVDIAEALPDRFFQLPTEIDFQNSHIVEKSRYFRRLKQHQDRQRKFILEAKAKRDQEWTERMAAVFPSFGIAQRVKEFDSGRGGRRVERLKNLLRQSDGDV